MVTGAAEEQPLVAARAIAGREATATAGITAVWQPFLFYHCIFIINDDKHNLVHITIYGSLFDIAQVQLSSDRRCGERLGVFGGGAWYGGGCDRDVYSLRNGVRLVRLQKHGFGDWRVELLGSFPQDETLVVQLLHFTWFAVTNAGASGDNLIPHRAAHLCMSQMWSMVFSVFMSGH